MSPALATTVAPGVLVIDDLLSADECAAFCAVADAAGYEDAPITTAAGFQMLKDVRNNDRAMVDDVARAAVLWERARPHLPQVDGQDPVGLNERLRFYRYRAGQKFDWHSDGYYQTPDRQLRSVYTFMIYLNEGCTGGETRIQHPERMAAAEAIFDAGDDPIIDVVPRTGRALAFLHPLRHTGAEVTAGVKYVLRSDVMYKLMERRR
ncbi:MAG: 2OG-Fe(II) oxygenase [Deltaproteobacteria bacterium]|nr:2OG-Fe(II) oxygenase [Deltaproteobacteria bacterium]